VKKLAAKKIGALITVDGEKEFNQNVTSCNKTLSSLKSEMGLVKAQVLAEANYKICDSANEAAASTKELVSDYGNAAAEMQAQGEYVFICTQEKITDSRN
jgi:tRNA A37 threonylcarbamoyladenosine dehydratase